MMIMMTMIMNNALLTVEWIISNEYRTTKASMMVMRERDDTSGNHFFPFSLTKKTKKKNILKR